MPPLVADSEQQYFALPVGQSEPGELVGGRRDRTAPAIGQRAGGSETQAQPRTAGEGGSLGGDRRRAESIGERVSLADGRPGRGPAAA